MFKKRRILASNVLELKSVKENVYDKFDHIDYARGWDGDYESEFIIYYNDRRFPLIPDQGMDYNVEAYFIPLSITRFSESLHDVYCLAKVKKAYAVFLDEYGELSDEHTDMEYEYLVFSGDESYEGAHDVRLYTNLQDAKKDYLNRVDFSI